MQEILGRFYVGDDLDQLSIGGDALTLTQGYYYLCGYTGETTDQLCEHLQAKIRAIGATQDASTVVYDFSTRRVTITLETAAPLSFTDSALAALLGFTGSQSSATTHTGTQTPQHCWAPDVPLTHYPGNSANIWVPRSTSRGGRAPDGTTFGTVGSLIYDAEVVWDLVDVDDVLKPSGGTVGDDLESWFEDVVHEDQPFRLVTDVDNYAAETDYVTCKWGMDDQETIGGFADYVHRERDEYQGLWTVRIPLMKHVASS